ncbi:hypothetical protein SCA03_17080 [Streptomyces cacaoi]|uniref:Tat pathway signal protein n=1 Tax=Streptomyces cacaoi TaxID=1898 RepID=A0A4Y3QWV5_STRCI|nr:hypothetical protein SCA03_17080 [Streptomyces cacaoi]
MSRQGSDKRIYSPVTGYIPVRIHTEITGDLAATSPSVTVRGVGENDWAEPRNTSEPLVLNAPLTVPQDLLAETQGYSGGDRWSTMAQAAGQEATALALHGANLAARSDAEAYNFIGHSRGAMECIMAAWFLYAYGREDMPVRIFAIDPVPGPGDWYGITTQLSPNVAEYVGITAWDHLDTGFNGLVPRPNARMTGSSETVNLGKTWSTLADDYQLTDPLGSIEPSPAQPTGYRLFVSRGRHGTVAGNTTSDGKYDPDNVSESAARVPELIHRLARAHLTAWGTEFLVASEADSATLPQESNLDHALFDKMGGGTPRDSYLLGRPYVRRVSSISGLDPSAYYYLEDVVGNPPQQQPYPVTAARAGSGWVHWTFL